MQFPSRRFEKSFTQQKPLPPASLTAASDVLNHGRLHRYNRLSDEVTETARLEREFARWMGARYCLAVTSGGYAMACALRALPIRQNAPVLTNAFTLAPVPGAILAAGGRPVLVESTGDLVIDIDDLEHRIAETGSRHLLVSHMRGHICDMDHLMSVCRAHDVMVIEDCAHTMGAGFRDVRSGRHGTIACFSTQTYKHMNSGEGGLITTDDEDLMARMIVLSGSYMFYDQHDAGPGPDCYEELVNVIPNMSGRMDNLRAAILRPQLEDLAEACRGWTERYRTIESVLLASSDITAIPRSPEEDFVGSS
ncbi:MAG: DegT/DnrJ/EryC1/StrS aminotransferase family protein, partial [Rhodobacteraceae bacterium]|nr:DegT/DnrJ/EryC1/StrS aminotransferase family protein [Paracoccaceae bacterium]